MYPEQAFIRRTSDNLIIIFYPHVIKFKATTYPFIKKNETSLYQNEADIKELRGLLEENKEITLDYSTKENSLNKERCYYYIDNFIVYKLTHNFSYYLPNFKYEPIVYENENVIKEITQNGTIFPSRFKYNDIQYTFNPSIKNYIGTNTMEGGQTHATVLSRRRKIVKQGRAQYVRYKNQLIKLSEARKLEKQLARNKK